MSELTDRQTDLYRAGAMTDMDTDEIGQISPYPEGAHGNYDEDYPKPDPEKVEAELKSYDKSDVAEDN